MIRYKKSSNGKNLGSRIYTCLVKKTFNNSFTKKGMNPFESTKLALNNVAVCRFHAEWILRIEAGSYANYQSNDKAE